jgi:hypothetical protein
MGTGVMGSGIQGPLRRQHNRSFTPLEDHVTVISIQLFIKLQPHSTLHHVSSMCSPAWLSAWPAKLGQKWASGGVARWPAMGAYSPRLLNRLLALHNHAQRAHFVEWLQARSTCRAQIANLWCCSTWHAFIGVTMSFLPKFSAGAHGWASLRLPSHDDGAVNVETSNCILRPFVSCPFVL